MVMMTVTMSSSMAISMTGSGLCMVAEATTVCVILATLSYKYNVNKINSKSVGVCTEP